MFHSQQPQPVQQQPPPQQQQQQHQHQPQQQQQQQQQPQQSSGTSQPQKISTQSGWECVNNTITKSDRVITASATLPTTTTTSVPQSTSNCAPSKVSFVIAKQPVKVPPVFNKKNRPKFIRPHSVNKTQSTADSALASPNSNNPTSLRVGNIRLSLSTKKSTSNANTSSNTSNTSNRAHASFTPPQPQHKPKHKATTPPQQQQQQHKRPKLVGPTLPDGHFIKQQQQSRPQSSSNAYQRFLPSNHSTSSSTTSGSQPRQHQPQPPPQHQQGNRRKQQSRRFNMEANPELSRLLDRDISDEDEVGAVEPDNNGVADTLTPLTRIVAPGVCVECEEMAADVTCNECDDVYCNMCFSILHRKGSRLKHTTVPISAELKAQASCNVTKVGPPRSGGDHATSSSSSSSSSVVLPSPRDPTGELGVGSGLKRLSGEWFTMRARYIPVRLEMKERKRLRLAVSSLAVSDYTGRIDKPALQKSAKRTHQQLKEMCSNFTGLVVSTDASIGKEVVEQRDFANFEPFLKNIYEFARRHKIMNPEKLRTNYGKMVYMLQDSATEQAKGLLQFSLAKEINSVYAYLDKHEILGVLTEPCIAEATMEILPEKKSRSQIQFEIKTKENAQEKIARKFCNHDKKMKEKIKWCLYSISDNFSFLNSNRKPIDTMIQFLKTYFKPGAVDEGFSLAVSSGVEGSRLTHNHTRHYHYVLQSLTLWREIADDMFRLWSLAEQDLLAEDNPYVLKDTGQGLQRVQAAPRVHSAMRTILHNCQLNLGEWIGSSVIHLGDSNVPNAMLFVDKYTQVARILSPIITTIREIDVLVKEDGMKVYIKKSFGSGANLKKIILHDFFKNAFDGSGADNFFDAGSCIDGRLTSAWNWCSTLQEKSFHPVFLLAGFIGFDGDFQE